MAVLAFQVAGAVIGSYFGPVGAAIGSALGAALGNALFPQKLNGPTLNDLRAQGSSYGLPVGIGWGSFRTPGTIIDRPEKFTPHETSSGGKGGPQITTTSYSIDYLQLVLCITRHRKFTLGRVWANKRLVDDYREGSTVTEHLPLVFYDGSIDQVPDPTLEAVHGAGTISAYRGRATVVFTQLALAPYGNALPIFEFELIPAVPVDPAPIEAVFTNEDPGYTWPADWDQFDPSAPGPVITKWPLPGSDERIRVRQRNSATVRLYDNDTGDYITSAGLGDDDDFPADANIGFGGGFEAYAWPIGIYRYSDGTSTPLWTHTGNFQIGATAIHHTGTDAPVITSEMYANVGGVLSTNGGTNWAESAGLPVGYARMAFGLSQDGKILIVIMRNPSDNSFHWYRIIDGVVEASGPSELGFGISNYPTMGVTSLLLNPFMLAVENNGRYIWSGTTLTNAKSCGVSHIDDDGTLRADPIAGSLALPTATSGGSSQVSLATLATEGYAGVVYENVMVLMRRVTARASPITRLSDVASDVCTVFSKMSADQIDVTDIEDIPVRSFLLDQIPVTGRAAFEAILAVYAVRTVDSAGVIKFVKAAKASLVTIPTAELAAHLEGEELPARLQTTRGSDANIPLQYVIKYINIDADYLMGTQQSPKRMVGESSGISVVTVPVGLTDAEAKRLVESWAQIAVLERDPSTWYTSRKYIAYEATDVVTIGGVDYWITNKTERTKGVIEWQGRKSKASVYAQPGIGGDSGSGVPGQEIPTPQETELVVIDGPFPQEGREGLIQVAMQGALRRSWKGAALFKSTDGGSNYSEVLTSTAPGTIGEALTVLPAYGGGNTMDALSRAQLLIHPGGGDLASVTADRAEQDNLLMWGAESLAFMRAELLSSDDSGKTYEVSRFLRGLHGTEHMMRGHAVGDLVTMMSTAIPIDALFAEYGQTVLYKAVTLGRSLASATPVSFRSNGVSRAPWAPVHLGVGVGYEEAGPMTRFFRFRWMERMRLHNAWLDFVDLPPDEAVEKYRVQIWEDGSYQTVKRTIIVVAGVDFTSGDPYAKYTDDQQTADFGAPFDSPSQVAWSVAKWGVLGWGYDSLGRLPLIVPTTTPGYVPPNPPPVDGIHGVMPWVEAARILSGPFGANDQWHIEVTTGGTSTPPYGPGITLPRISGAEDPGSPCPREWALSTIRGDFVGLNQPGSRNSGGPSIGTYFALGTGTGGGFYPTLQLHTKYWLNVRNLPATEVDREMFCDIENITAYP